MFLSKSAFRLQMIASSGLLLAFMLGSVPVIFSQPVRHAYLQMIDRQIAKVAPPQFVFAGDSLTAYGNWGSGMVARNPFAVVNLAEPGASIDEVAVQVARARAFHGKFLLVMAGTNDIHQPLEQIVCNFASLLGKVPEGQRIIVTLIPYTSFREDAGNITAANREIKRLAEQKGADIIDINSLLSTNGILHRELTTDGVHFNQKAYQIWSSEILKHIEE